MSGSVKAAPNLILLCRWMCLALIVAALGPVTGAAQETFISARQPERIELLVGKSMVLQSCLLYTSDAADDEYNV
mgnify:CR=1 FL=1